MSEQEKSDDQLATREARPAERGATSVDIAQLEASLLADIAAFDFETARRAVQGEALPKAPVAAPASAPAFPEIIASGAAPRHVATPKDHVAATTAKPLPAGGLLAELRDRAARFQREQQLELVQRTAVNEAIDQALRRAFDFLHELVAQLNVVKPEIPRAYHLIENLQLAGLAWQEGFADYRMQSQSAGGLFDVVTMSYQLQAAKGFSVSREGGAVERFRTLLFDYGLQFSCKEFKNAQRYVERADFDVPGQLSVNIRWRADFNRGRVMLETRNLERLGSASYSIIPESMTESLFDDFGRLILGEANTFREQLRRAHQPG